MDVGAKDEVDKEHGAVSGVTKAMVPVGSVA